MKLSGHETDTIYRRYDIISEEDLTESMNRVQEHVKKRQTFGRLYRWLNVGSKLLSHFLHKGHFRR
jgi:hypothetical protein